MYRLHKKQTKNAAVHAQNAAAHAPHSKTNKKLNHMKHFDKAVLIALLAFGTHSTLVARNTIGGG